MIAADCHCGAVRIAIATALKTVTECNCSICRRLGVLWAYYDPQDVTIVGETEIYMWGDRSLRFHRCKHCGCITHWSRVDESVPRMGVNARLVAPELLKEVRVRHLDGAATWEYLD